MINHHKFCIAPMMKKTDKHFRFMARQFTKNSMLYTEMIHSNAILKGDADKLLKYDNVISGKYKTNSDIGFPAKCLFEKEVEKYCYMWRQGGQFSKKNIS